MKENVDKMIEYMVDIRNMYKYTFVPIIHLNRSMTDVNRLKFMDDMIFPNGDDIKDRPQKNNPQHLDKYKYGLQMSF